jgi:hypothetical protein
LATNPAVCVSSYFQTTGLWATSCLVDGRRFDGVVQADRRKPHGFRGHPAVVLVDSRYDSKLPSMNPVILRLHAVWPLHQFPDPADRVAAGVLCKHIEKRKNAPRLSPGRSTCSPRSADHRSVLERIELARTGHRHSEGPQRVQHPDRAEPARPAIQRYRPSQFSQSPAALAPRGSSLALRPPVFQAVTARRCSATGR